MITKELSSLNTPLRRSTSFQATDVLEDFKLSFKSRLVSNHIRKEVLIGKAKFGIEAAGKELLQIAMAKYFQKGDFFSGYYRDQTFMMKKGLASVQSLFASLYADASNDIYSGGRQMNNHFATPLIDKNGEWTEHIDNYNVASALSPLAGNVPHALGLALASQKYRLAAKSDKFTHQGNEISICVVGDATTSEGVFFEAINAAGVMKVPMVFVIQDDGYGISVPTKYQTTKGSISEILKGFQKNEAGEGLNIYTAKAWDYAQLHDTFEKAIGETRLDHTPCIIHIQECTQPNGHSTSGSHERYKGEDRLQWEKDQDCLLHFEQWIINNKYATTEELDELKMDVSTEFKKEKKEAWRQYIDPVKDLKKELIPQLKLLISEFPNHDDLKNIISSFNNAPISSRSEILKFVEKIKITLAFESSKTLSLLHSWYQTRKAQTHATYDRHLYSDSPQAAINIPAIHAEYNDDAEMINGFEILNKYFDQLFEKDDRVYAFGEDVGKIGGVNQAFVGLQAKYGEDRIFDTGIREWTIIGQAIGMAMRGLRPIAELQYLDYLAYAFSALTDDLATLRYRTNGQQKAPAIIRTRGHRLEGIWHSGSPIGMLLNSMRGIYVLTPRNMTQAAGMYNTMIQSDDPAIIIECLNGYRKKEKLPSNLGTYTVPLGVPEVLHKGEDITIVTYGSCVAEAEEAVRALSKLEISIELIDAQTLLPFDLEHRILDSIKKTNRVIFLDEDVPGGASAYMMREVLETQGAYKYLDSAPLCITAKDYRPPYGDDGDYVSKPNAFDIISAAVQIMYEVEPDVYGKLVA